MPNDLIPVCALPTDEEVDQFIAELEAMAGPLPDDGDESEVLPGWDELWQRYDALLEEAPYLSE